MMKQMQNYIKNRILLNYCRKFVKIGVEATIDRIKVIISEAWFIFRCVREENGWS